MDTQSFQVGKMAKSVEAGKFIPQLKCTTNTLPRDTSI